MTIYLYFKSGDKHELIPQIRLTCSKNGITGTAIFEINIEKVDFLFDLNDPIFNVGIENNKSLRMADICYFIWCSGKPIKLLAIFIFSNLYEKQDFFNYYLSYATNNSLEFFPAQGQEKTLSFEYN